MTHDSTLSVTLNGSERRLPAGTTVAGLVAELGLAPEQVAVERNGRVVRRAQHGDVLLEAGDRLEVVTLVGGG